MGHVYVCAVTFLPSVMWQPCTFELKGNPKLLMPDGVFQVLQTDIRRELRFKLNISYF